MTNTEFQHRCVGWDNCCICGWTRPLIRIEDKSVGPKLLELYPDGRPTLACLQCTNRLERASHLVLVNLGGKLAVDS